LTNDPSSRKPDKTIELELSDIADADEDREDELGELGISDDEFD
jgi:hypothetical protein